jgi:hypothetical protein
MFEIFILKLWWNIVWADGSARARPSRCTAHDHRPRTVHICHARQYEASPCQSRKGKKARAQARPSQGVGRWRPIPPPTPNAVVPHYDMPRAILLSKSWLNEQTVLVDSKLNLNNCLRAACRAAVEERKELAAHGLPPTFDHLVRSKKVYSRAPANSSIPPCQNQDASGGWRPLWRPCRPPGWGSDMQWGHLSQWIASGAQHVPVVWPLFTFGCPLAALCWASAVVLPFQSHMGPSKRSSVRDLPSRWAAVELSTLQLWGLHSLSAAIYSPVLSSIHVQRACAGPRAAALGDERVGLSGELVSAQHAVVLLPDPCHAASGHHLSVHVQIVACQVSPTSWCAHRQSEWSHYRPRSSLLTWHPSASTDDRLLTTLRIKQY